MFLAAIAMSAAAAARKNNHKFFNDEPRTKNNDRIKGSHAGQG
jgi:hypothetical protein